MASTLPPDEACPTHLSRKKSNQVNSGECCTFVGCPMEKWHFGLGNGGGEKGKKGSKVASLETG